MPMKLQNKDQILISEAYKKVCEETSFDREGNPHNSLNDFNDRMVSKETSYSAMENLGPKAAKIREMLLGIGDDEMTEEDSYVAAREIAGGESEWSNEEYQELIESLAHVIRAFGFRQMN